MRTIPLQINNIQSYPAHSLAHSFNRRLEHIGEPLVNVTIEVDSYSIDRDYATKTYDYLTIKVASHWNMYVTFRNKEHDSVRISLRRLISSGGMVHNLAVTGLDPNTTISKEYIKSQLLSDDIALIDRNDGWEVITMVMQAYASSLANCASLMASNFILPTGGEANVSLVTAGRTPSGMNQYFITAYNKPDAHLNVHTVTRFYGNRIGDDLEDILQYKYHSIGNSSQVINTYLPISWFARDLYFQVHEVSMTLPYETMDTMLSVYDVPQLIGATLHERNGFIGVKPALQRTYLSKHTLNSFFGYDFEKCAITGRYYAKPGADHDMYETLYSISDMQTLQPVSVYALRRHVGRLVVNSECEDCGTYTHIGQTEFYKAVQERYSHVFGVLADFTDGHYGTYTMENLTDDQKIISTYRELLRIAESEYPDYEPDYYCDSCDRGEDYYEEDEDNDHRNEYLDANQIDKLSTIATNAGLELYHRDGFSFFTDDKTAFKNNFEWRNYNNYEVHEYSYRPKLTFVNGDCMDKTKLYLGVEWEMDNGGEMHRKAVPINSALSNNQPFSWTMTDGSLHNGIEIATMPATLDAHTNVFNWDLACQTAVALGYRAHDTSTAGIHVHINRNFFSDDKKLQLYRASLMALIMERNWNEFVKFSRRRYNRLDQWAKKKKLADNLNTDITTDGMVDRVNKEYGNGDKYLAINLRNSNTFELRIFRGTLKADSIKATLQFVSNFANFCKYTTLAKAQTATFEDIINYKEYPELKAYWEENKNREVND